MIIHSFDNKTEPPMKMEDFYGEQKHITDTCLVLFSWKLHQYLLDTYPCREIGGIYAANGKTTIWQLPPEKKGIAFYLSPIGSSSAAQYCMETNWVIGATNFVMFGSAGALDAEKTAGKFVVPTEAYRDEGMSYHYAPPADYIAIKNHAVLADFFRQNGYPFVEGRIWTTDAFMRETVGLIEQRKSEGCLAVEMEAAGAEALCDFYGFDLYHFVVTGDVLSSDGYSVDGLTGANHSLGKLHAALAFAETLMK